MYFQFKLGPTEMIRATVTEGCIKGPSSLSIRVWWYVDDEWVPTGKGFTVPIDRAEKFVEGFYKWFGGKGAKMIAVLREQSDEDEEDERPVRRTTRTKKTVRSRREESAPRARTKASEKAPRTRTKRSARR